MSVLSLKEFHSGFYEYLERVTNSNEQLVVGSGEEPQFAVVPYAWLEAYERLLDIQNAEEVLKAVEKEGTVPWKEVQSRAGL